MYELRDYQTDAVDQLYGVLTDRSLPDAKPVICLPTGAGKSLVIAEIARRAVIKYGGRVLILQHRKELIEQNAAKIQSLLPECNIGLYSAAIRKRDTLNNVVVAGIQSVYDKANELGKRNLILIDECHLVPERDEGMYRTILGDMERMYRSRIAGLTATPYRTETSYIYGKYKQFSCMIEPEGSTIPELIERGLLCPLVSSSADASVDTSGLHRRAGEFVAKECEMLFGERELLEACGEIIAKTQDRHSVLIFSTTVAHAKAVAQIIHKSTGAPTALISGSSTETERDAIIDAFRRLRIKYLVNVDVLTTGFDAPVVDCVAILRATASPGLYAQIVGRGMRVDPSKQDCLVLDFGENIKRHGPLDKIRPKRKEPTQAEPTEQDGEEQEDMTGRICPACEVAITPETIECECGFRLPIKFRHNSTTDNSDVITRDAERFYEVENVLYRVVRPKNQSPKLLVEYIVKSNGKTRLPNDMPVKFVAFDSTNEHIHRSLVQWWARRTDADFPSDAYEALKIAKQEDFAKPVSIMARKEGSSWRITEGPIRKVVSNG